jgi:hypothetical protein
VYGFSTILYFDTMVYVTYSIVGLTNGKTRSDLILSVMHQDI